MAEEAQTFEEARSEWSEEREEAGEEPYWGDETPVIPEEGNLEDRVDAIQTFLEASPQELARRRGRLPGEPRERLTPIQIRLGELEGVLDELRDELANATSTQDFLNNIAQSNLFVAERLGVLASTQVEMLEAIFDLLNWISPFDQLSVSGTNDIEDADTAEPVVPGSDNTAVPTKALFIKASSNNEVPVTIGDDQTNPSNGWILYPNDHIILNMDLRQEIIYMAAEQPGPVVEILGFV